MKSVLDMLNEKEENLIEKYVISNMPIILMIFANLGIIVADYRAYDVLNILTGSSWKALMAVVFSCAVPFVLWELAWQYKFATDGWRTVALCMAFLSFGTSIIYGLADYVGAYDSNGVNMMATVLIGGAVVLTGIHIVFALLYFYNDPNVAMKRLQTQALGKMATANTNAVLANTILAQAKDVNAAQRVLVDIYGEQEANNAMALLTGKKEIVNPTSGSGKS